MDVLMDILMYALPAGFLVQLVNWIVNRRLYNARIQKEIHDTYKKMYEDDQPLILEFRNEAKKLHQKVSRFECAFAKALVCRYWDRCPVRFELQRQKKSDKLHKEGQFGDSGNAEDDIYTGSPIKCGAGDSDGEPP